MAPEAVLAAWSAAPASASLGASALRLARGVDVACAALAGALHDPLDLALLGLALPPDPAGEADLGRAVLAATAWVDRDPSALDPRVAADLERRAHGSPQWWVPAARAHVACSPDRERQARKVLASQDLPYVTPGELHPLQVEVLAVGDRLLEALHVDHVRRLTSLTAEALVLDARVLGLWFWPNLRSLAQDRLARPLVALPGARRLVPGSLGLAAAYLARTGGDPAPALARAGPVDQLLFALATLADRSA